MILRTVYNRASWFRYSVACVDLNSRTNDRVNTANHHPRLTSVRPIIALYDQTQDAVGGGGSNSSPSQPLVTSRLHRKQAADSNARTTPSIVRSRGSNFRNHIIKSAYQIGDAPCDEQTKVATVANQGHISVTLQ